MSAGITRVHGTAILPSQRPSTVSFYTITIAGSDVTSEVGVVNGVWDQVFRTAVDQFATVAMIGTPVYAASNTTLRFAIEDTGTDALSASGLGLGSSEGTSFDTTAHALAAAIKALGTVNGFNLNTSNTTVATFTL
jgi:hypothetical protein